MILPKNKINLIIVFIFSIIFLSACGFKKINQLDKKLIHIQNIETTGDNRIAYNLKNSILLNSSVNSINKVEVKIKITKKKTIKEKDKTGKITKHNITINAYLDVKDLNQNKTIKKSFSKNREINVSSSHSVTIQSEKKIIQNISDLLAEDISNFFNLYYRN